MGELLRWLGRIRPFPYPRQTAVSAMALLYISGGVTILLVLVCPHPPTLSVGVILLLGSVAPLIGLALYYLRYRLPEAALPWLLGAFTGIVSLLVATSGSRTVAVSFSFFFIWVVMYCLLFFTPLCAAVQIGIAAAAYGVCLASLQAVSASPFSAVEPICLIAVITTMGLVVTLLAKARERSETDPLTLVVNRRGLDRVLESEIHAAALGGGPFVVAMIDVDHFKSINDTGGHAAGDRLLQDLVGGWQTVLRVGDVLGRIGGDEFVVVLPRCAWQDAAPVLERLRVAAGREGVTCSLGGAPWQAGDSMSLLLGRADSALYEAKRLGRDRVAWTAAI
jgi:diguanylate cyclase (GGDEF)-like protein